MFLNIKRKKVALKQDEQVEGVPEKVSKMAIGVEGGFSSPDVKKYSFEDSHQVVVLPEFKAYAMGD